MTDTERKLAGKFIVEHFKDGRLVNRYEIENAVNNSGHDYLIDAFIEATTPLVTKELNENSVQIPNPGNDVLL